MMLDLLEDYLNYKGYSYERIDGKIRGSDRQVGSEQSPCTRRIASCILFQSHAVIELFLLRLEWGIPLTFFVEVCC